MTAPQAEPAPSSPISTSIGCLYVPHKTPMIEESLQIALDAHGIHVSRVISVQILHEGLSNERMAVFYVKPPAPQAPPAPAPAAPPPGNRAQRRAAVSKRRH